MEEYNFEKSVKFKCEKDNDDESITYLDDFLAFLENNGIDTTQIEIMNDDYKNQ